MKIKNDMISIKKAFFFAFISIGLKSCYICKYSIAIRDDANNRRIENRNFIKKIQFVGTIKNKYLGNGEAKYKVLIGNYMNTSLCEKLIDCSYYSFYSIKDSNIDIAIAKVLYTEVAIGDIISKSSDTDSVIVHGKHILFIDW